MKQTKTSQGRSKQSDSGASDTTVVPPLRGYRFGRYLREEWSTLPPLWKLKFVVKVLARVRWRYLMVPALREMVAGFFNLRAK
jgi:hypothetical protein